jgi:hypothetical protein
MAASVPWQEDHFAPGQAAGEKLIRRIPERGFDFDPLLLGEAFDVIKAAAADDADF